MTEADIEALHAHGLDDAAITIAVQVIGYFNYINRVADALQVGDEPWFDIPREEWHDRKGKTFSSYGAH